MIVDELNLPAANITRITRGALPPATKLSKEAREGLTRAASIFILYVNPLLFALLCSTHVCLSSAARLFVTLADFPCVNFDFRCLTNAASEASTSEKRQTIQTKDIFTALEDMDLADLVPEVQQRLKETSKSATPSKSSKAASASPSSQNPDSKAGSEAQPEDEQGSVPSGNNGSGEQ